MIKNVVMEDKVGARYNTYCENSIAIVPLEIKTDRYGGLRRRKLSLKIEYRITLSDHVSNFHSH